MSYSLVSERQTGLGVIQFTLDQGGEFLNELLESELKALGLVLHTTSRYTPQQNVVAKREHCSVITKACAMVVKANLPLTFWYLACSTAVFLLNRTITFTIPNRTTPFEMWYFRSPSLSHLKVFGCAAYGLLRKALHRSKFHPVSSKGVLVGFDQDNYNFLIYDLDTQKAYMSHDVTFDENHFPFNKSSEKDSESTLDQTERVEIQFEDDSDEEVGERSSVKMVTPSTDDTQNSSHLHNLDDKHSEEHSREKGVTPRGESVPDNVGSDNEKSTHQEISETQQQVSTRSKGKQVLYCGMCNMAKVSSNSPVFNCLRTAFSNQALPSSNSPPKSLKSALNSYDGPEWMKACKKKVRSLKQKKQ